MAEAEALANRILANAPIAVRIAKESIDAEYDLNADDAILYENNAFGRCFETQDQKEGMNAFLNKRKPEFKNN